MNYDTNNLNNLIDKFKKAFDEVYSDLYLMFYNKQKWPDEYKLQIVFLKESGEKLWNIIPNDSFMKTNLAIMLNRLDMLKNQAVQSGLA